MALYLGSFAGGLWQGAASAMQLARDYQAFQVQQAAFDEADKVEAARREQADQAAYTNLTRSLQPALQPNIPGFTTGASAPPAPPTPEQTATKPDITAVPSSTPAAKHPAGITTDTRALPVSYGPTDLSIRQQQPPAAPPPPAAPEQRPRIVPLVPTPIVGATSPTGYAGPNYQGWAGGPSGVATPPPYPAPQPPPAVTGSGGQYPGGSLLPPSAQQPTPPPQQGRGATTTYPATPPPATAPPPTPTPAPAITTTPPPPQSTVGQVINALSPTQVAGPGVPTAPNNIPLTAATAPPGVMGAIQAGRAQAGAPVAGGTFAGPGAPPPGSYGGPPVAGAGAPGAVAPAPAPAPPPAAPPATGGAIGGAQAAPVPGAAVSRPQQPPAPAVKPPTYQPPTEYQGEAYPGQKDGVAAPPPGVAAPPKGAPPADSSKPTEVQKSPGIREVTSEPAAKGPTYSVSPSYWQWLQANAPDKAKMVLEAIQGTGVTPEQFAAHWFQESHFALTSPDSSVGAQGPMQVEPNTAVASNFSGDMRDTKGGLRAGALALQHYNSIYGGTSPIIADIAYRAGDKTADIVLKYGIDAARPTAPTGSIEDIEKLYGVGKFTQEMVPYGGSRQGYTPQGMVAAQNANPDPGNVNWVIPYLVNNGPPNMALSDRWRAAEDAGIRAAILSGHPEAVPMVSTYIAGLAHQGAIANLISAYQSLTTGDAEGAARSLAMAHAFVPDGAAIRAGVYKGQLWAQRVDEGTGKPTSDMFRVTPEMIGEQMLAYQHSQDFLKAVQDYRMENAQIAYYGARGTAAMERPEASIYNQQQREQTQLEIERMREQARQEQQTNKLNEETKQAGEVDKGVTKGYGDLSNLPIDDQKTNPRMYNPNTGQADTGMVGAQSTVDRALQYPEGQGGAGMTAASANAIARGVMDGSKIMRMLKGKSGDVGVGIFDKGTTTFDADHADAVITGNQARQLTKLPQLQIQGAPPGVAEQAAQAGPAITGQKTSLAMPPTTPGRGAIGAGAGSPMAFMSGAGMGIGGSSGQPQQPQPPGQTAPQSLVA